jgi:aminodeoxyfutalosine deaminase
MIIRARTVVTMHGAPIENGAVAVSANRIVGVDRFNDIKARHTGNIIDLGEQTLLPGLINAHCHFDYSCLRGTIPPQKSFTDWIRAINAKKSELSPKDYIASINDGFEEAKRSGTTAVANLTAFPELIPQIQLPIRTWWFAELIDIRAPERANEFVESAIESLGRARSPSAQLGLAPHALFTASKNLFRRCEEIAQREQILLTTHLAESREETAMFRDGSGPLYEFLKSIGRSMDDCGNATPLGLFVGALGERARPRWIVAHLNELTGSDFDLLQRSNQKFHVVHCPRSRKYFDHDRFAFEQLRALGFNICLGTDSLASNESLSLFAEMRAFQMEFPSVSAEEILQMATVNPARALRQENALGKIRRGAFADLIAVPLNGSNLFEEIVAFSGEPWMMVAGRVQ